MISTLLLMCAFIISQAHGMEIKIKQLKSRNEAQEQSKNAQLPLLCYISSHGAGKNLKEFNKAFKSLHLALKDKIIFTSVRVSNPNAILQFTFFYKGKEIGSIGLWDYLSINGNFEKLKNYIQALLAEEISNVEESGETYKSCLQGPLVSDDAHSQSQTTSPIKQDTTQESPDATSIPAAALSEEQNQLESSDKQPLWEPTKIGSGIRLDDFDLLELSHVALNPDQVISYDNLKQVASSEPSMIFIPDQFELREMVPTFDEFDNWTFID